MVDTAVDTAAGHGARMKLVGLGLKYGAEVGQCRVISHLQMELYMTTLDLMDGNGETPFFSCKDSESSNRNDAFKVVV